MVPYFVCDAADMSQALESRVAVILAARGAKIREVCRGCQYTLCRNIGKKGSELDGFAMSLMSSVTASWCLIPQSGKNLETIAAAKMW